MAVYCTKADIQRLFSTCGVASYADHHDATDPVDVVEDCILQASEELEMYLRGKFEPASLAQSGLVTRWCTTMACYFLTLRRGNEPPQSLIDEFNRITGVLEKILSGTATLPGVAQRAGQQMTMSNLRVNRRFATQKIRAIADTSSNTPSAVDRHLDDTIHSDL